MQSLTAVMEFLWGIPLMICMFLTGLILTVKTRFFQFTSLRFIFKNTIGTLFGKNVKKIEGNGALRPFQAVSAVLASTIGAGSIAGVASAIAIGGPGAVFWMWIISLFGMMTKMAEVTLAVYYREKGANGHYYGGPMYYMRGGLKRSGKTLAMIYAITLLIFVITNASFVQVNTMASAILDIAPIPPIVIGVAVIVIGLIAVAGGITRIGDFCGKMVPPMCILYIVCGFGVVIYNYRNIPEAFELIFRYAFAPAPAVGGFAGAGVMMAMSRGASRGIFSNEAGEGTSTPIHATAITDHPIRQGLWGCLEVFIVTVIICNLTAFSILTSGEWSSGVTGAVLTINAFQSFWGSWGKWIVSIATILFTFSSFIGYFVQYEAVLTYLWGEKVKNVLKWTYFLPILLSVTMSIEAVWTLADLSIGMLVLPNILSLVLMRGKFIELFNDFIKKSSNQETAEGYGTYIESVDVQQK